MSLSFGFKPPATKPVVSNNTIGRSFIPPALQVLPTDKFISLIERARIDVQATATNVKNAINNIPQTVENISGSVGRSINNVLSPVSNNVNKTLLSAGAAGSVTILPIGIALAIFGIVALKIIK